MDARLRAEANKLRAMGSAAAATHIIENWPQAHRHAFILIEHLSWATGDQVRLSDHFLRTKPFASAFPYEAFASFMSLPRFLTAIEKVWPADDRDRNLLMYHLRPILRKFATSDANRHAIQSFLSSHRVD